MNTENAIEKAKGSENKIETNQPENIQEENIMNEVITENNEPEVKILRLDQLKNHEAHPRSTETGIKALKESLKIDGLLTPFTVMKSAEDNLYTILDGTRRCKALQELGIESAACIIKKEAEDAEAAHAAYVMNMEREALNPLEQALHIKKMRDDFGFTFDQLEVKGYGTKSTISNKLKILNLPEEVQNKIAEGKLSEAIGRELLKLPNTGEQERMAKQAIKNDLSVAKVKSRIINMKRNEKSKSIKNRPNAPDQEIQDVYFQDSRNMAEMTDKSVHFIMGSPPYGLGFEFEKEHTPETVLGENMEVLKECARILAPGGIIALNVKDIQDLKKGKDNNTHREWFFVGHQYQQFLRKYKIYLTDVIQWEKPIGWGNKISHTYTENTRHTSYRIIHNTEQILIFRKEGEREVPSEEIVHKSRITKEQWIAWTPGVWDTTFGPGEKTNIDHPCPYPEELCNRLIKMYSYEGDTVLDPWLGSGTTVKSAIDLDRRGVGYEREVMYKNTIMKKLGLLPETIVEDKPVSMVEFSSKSQEEIEALYPDNPESETQLNDDHKVIIESFTNMPESTRAQFCSSPEA